MIHTSAYITPYKPLIFGIILMSLIFMIEINTGSLVGTVAYIFIVFYILWFSRLSQFPAILGGFATLFIITGFFYLFTSGEANQAFIINRILSVAIVWVAVYFTFRFKKLSEEEHTKNDQLHALFENAHEGILFSDVNGKIIMANPFLEKMFGYAPGELINKNIKLLMPERSVANHVQYLKNFVNKPYIRPKGRDFNGLNKDGNEFPVEISLSHFNDKGQLTIIAFILDATEKKKHQQLIEDNINRIKNYNIELEEEVRQRTQELKLANRQLKKSQYLYQAMAHNFPDGMIGVLDREMNYLLVDGQDLKFLEVNGSDIFGRSKADAIHSAILNNSQGALEKVYKGEDISFDIELHNKVYNISSVPIHGSGDEINEILIVAKNVTDQKKLEKDLIANLEKEKELNLLKTRFVSTASHEFRTPLTTILSSAFLLEHYTGEKLEKERKKHLDRIKKSVNAVTELLNDFLSLGKLEEGKIQVVYSKINLKSFIQELLQEAELLKKDDQKFQFEYSGEEEIKTDKHLLRNILMNLISNSIKYTSASDTIIIAASVFNNKVSLEVTDHGIGIPPKEHKHIFKRFFRAQNVSEIQGTGLGLNIVQKYTSLLNGTIDFTSEPKERTTFTLKIPLNVNSLNEPILQ